jgi:hypothetical protein
MRAVACPSAGAPEFAAPDAKNRGGDDNRRAVAVLRDGHVLAVSGPGYHLLCDAAGGRMIARAQAPAGQTLSDVNGPDGLDDVRDGSTGTCRTALLTGAFDRAVASWFADGLAPNIAPAPPRSVYSCPMFAAPVAAE